jgi:leucine dehydrogenase
MDLFDYADELDYGELHFKVNPETGLHAIVAIHDLTLGPAIGGCRFIEYDTTDDAIRDAMRLGRGMTYKAAITNLPHGGAKSVLVRPDNLDPEQRVDIIDEFGEFVDSLDGDYITAEDSGTSVEDMNRIGEKTDYVLGRGPDKGGSGDPSPHTATGVRRGLEAAVKFDLGRDDLDGLTVAIQGVGAVGYHLAKQLHERGVNLVVTDINQRPIDRCVDEFGAEAVGTDEIYGVDCDIFAPCALGAILNDETIPQLSCDIVAGSANNQLAESRHDAQLMERGITYAPDYLVNAAGLIYVASFYSGEGSEAAAERIDGIYDTMLEILERAESEGKPTGHVTNQIAEERIQEARD